MSPLEIRVVNHPKDLQHLLTIRRSYHDSHVNLERRRETYLDDLSDGDGRECLLAVDHAGRAIASAQLVWALDFLAPGEVHLHDLRVKSNLQSKGVGRSFMEKLEQLAVERGYARINLFVESENRRARDFYGLFGFREVQNLACPEGCLALEKSLSSALD